MKIKSTIENYFGLKTVNLILLEISIFRDNIPFGCENVILKTTNAYSKTKYPIQYMFI